MKGPPSPGRLAREPDPSFARFRDYCRAGGYSLDDGSFTPRPSLEDMAERFGLTVGWVHKLSAKWQWRDRVTAYDSAVGSYLASRSVGPGQLAGILAKAVGSLSEDDLSEAKAGEKIALAKFAADQLSLVRGKEELRPITLHGVSFEAIANALTPEEQATLKSLLMKLKDHG